MTAPRAWWCGTRASRLTSVRSNNLVETGLAEKNVRRTRVKKGDTSTTASSGCTMNTHASSIRGVVNGTGASDDIWTLCLGGGIKGDTGSPGEHTHAVVVWTFRGEVAKFGFGAARWGCSR